MVETTEAEHNKDKRIKSHEENLRDLWDNIKHLHQHSHYSGPRKRKEKDLRK